LGEEYISLKKKEKRKKPTNQPNEKPPANKQCSAERNGGKTGLRKCLLLTRTSQDAGDSNISGELIPHFAIVGE
jgi:hypothetical protein